jgi:hypothetical protein
MNAVIDADLDAGPFTGRDDPQPLPTACMQLEWDDDGDYVDRTLSIKMWAMLLLRQAPALFCDRPLPRRPMPDSLDTESRIKVYRARCRAGRALYHPRDARPAELCEGFVWRNAEALMQHFVGRHV